MVNAALRAGLRGLDTPQAHPYRLTPASLGQPRAGIDLDKALGLAEALENEEMIVKLVQGR